MQQVKLGLASFLNWKHRISWWEDEIIDTLAQCWPQDYELKNIALNSVVRRFMPAEWEDHLALKFLVQAWPGDNEAAEAVAGCLRRETYVDIHLDFPRRQNQLLSGFAGHPIVVPAAIEWLEKHGRARHDPVALAHVAMLARTPESRALLIEDLKLGNSLPQWPIQALLDLIGPQDTELRETVFALFDDQSRSASVANFLPRFITDRNECRQRLLRMLTPACPFYVSNILDGLKELDDVYNPATVAILEERLRNDADRRFWSATSNHLLEALPHNPLVRAAAAAEFSGSAHTLSALAKAYAADAEFRPQLEVLLEPLHEDLRLVLVNELRRFALREDSFARDLLAKYTREWDTETRTAAADAYYDALGRLGLETEEHIAQLRSELTETPDISSTCRQAAVAGLIALRRPRELLESALEGNDAHRRLSLHAHFGENWELIRVLVEQWESLAEACGEDVWKIFREWDVLVWHLAQAGKRAAALTVPADIAQGARQHTQQDEEGFRALAVLEAGQPSFRELCLGLLGRFRKTGASQGVSWGHNESMVLFQVAHYLADHHAGESEVGAQLEELAQDSFEPTWVLIALCRGWPHSTVLDKIWGQRARSSLPDTASAWLVSIKADATQFSEYVLALPKALKSDGWWHYPMETLRPVRKRLAADLASQRLVARGLESVSDLDVIASVAQLLGMTLQDRAELHDWASRSIAAHLGNSALLSLGYDMLSGRIRPVKLCILDGLLTR